MAAIIQIRMPQDSGASADEKERQLLAKLAEIPSVIVALSGGADSAYFAWAAQKALGTRALSVTALSPSYSAHDRDIVEDFVRAQNIHHEFVETHEMENPAYRANAADRCFHCKDELFDVLDAIAQQRGFAATAYGVNADDTLDFRPGHRAAKEHRVLAPLLDVGLRKTEIRELSQRAGLPTWNRPASACLASRVPYGTEVTPERLGLIERGEAGSARPRLPANFASACTTNSRASKSRPTKCRARLHPKCPPTSPRASRPSASPTSRSTSKATAKARSTKRSRARARLESGPPPEHNHLNLRIYFVSGRKRCWEHGKPCSSWHSPFATTRGENERGGNMTQPRSGHFAIAIAIIGSSRRAAQMGPAVTGAFDRSFSVSAPIRLELSNASGNVTITGSSDNKVHVHGDVRSSGIGFDSPQKRLDAIVGNPPVEQKGDTIRVGKDLSKIHNVSIAYTIEVPHDTEISTQVASGSLHYQCSRPGESRSRVGIDSK